MDQQADPHADRPWLFKKGHPKYGGRKFGSQNSLPKLVRECVLTAAELEGSDGNGKDGLIGFLRRLANEDIRAFAMLLGRILPLEFASRNDPQVEVVYRTIEEVRAELEARGVSIKLLHEWSSELMKGSEQ